MLSLHPRYPVLKVPAPARLSAAVAQGLMMPEDRPPGGGNLRLHILYTYLNRRDRPISQTRAEEDIKSAGKHHVANHSKERRQIDLQTHLLKMSRRSGDDPLISF